MVNSIKLLNAYKTFGEGHCDYGLNSQGYRCPEFDKISWEDSILLFGCSHVFGIGLTDEQTMAHQLSLITGRPVINLGMGGSSCTYQWINSTILCENGIKPKAVIYYWPEWSRQSIFYNNDIYETKALGFWSVNSANRQSDFGIGLVLDPTHSKSIFKYQRDNVTIIWKPAPVLHYANYQDLTYTDMKLLLNDGDLARDHSHSGPRTNKNWAKIIANDLSKYIGTV